MLHNPCDHTASVTITRTTKARQTSKAGSKHRKHTKTAQAKREAEGQRRSTEQQRKQRREAGRRRRRRSHQETNQTPDGTRQAGPMIEILPVDPSGPDQVLARTPHGTSAQANREATNAPLGIKLQPQAAANPHDQPRSDTKERRRAARSKAKQDKLHSERIAARPCKTGVPPSN